MTILNILIFILILGIIVFIHEFGHFIFSKKFGVHVYEFSIGMGPKIYSFRRKNDETEYFIRLLPIGGYVKLAGEEIEDDKSVPKSKKLQNKTFLQRLIVMSSGAMFNFLLSFVLLFLVGVIYGASNPNPYIGTLIEDYPAIKTELKEGDRIISINNKKTKSKEDLLLILHDNKFIKDGVTFKVEDESKNIKEVFVIPNKETKDQEERYVFGFGIANKKSSNIVDIIKYPFVEFYNNIRTMIKIIGNLFAGKLGINNLAGPVGIFTTVEASVKSGFESVLSLIILLGINIGFINLIPFPAFDGGRILFLLIEKVRKKPLSIKVENTINAIGLILLLILMLVVTINDIGRLGR